MIRVAFDKNENDKALSLTVQGHASFADVGQDIVCASASILTYTLARAMEQLYENGVLYEDPIVRLAGGDALIKCRFREYLTFSDAASVFDVIYEGFSMLSENYPEYVDVLG